MADTCIFCFDPSASFGLLVWGFWQTCQLQSPIRAVWRSFRLGDISHTSLALILKTPQAFYNSFFKEGDFRLERFLAIGKLEGLKEEEINRQLAKHKAR